MVNFSCQNFRKYLQKKNYLVYGPFKHPGQFKKYLLPPEEILFNYGLKERVQNIKISKYRDQKICLFGLNIFDLKALNLWRHIFEKDLYFQNRLKKTLLIGSGPGAQAEFYVWKDKYEEDFLEHIQFDIFFLACGKKIEIFSGSRIGQNLLDSYGWTDYEHIQFAGPIKEEGILEDFFKIKENLEKMSPNDPLWQELGSQCLSCGQCSVHCPTCFCYDLRDQIIGSNQIKRQRIWSNCYLPEFSEITRQHKFLPTASSRIFFWYYHKFVRNMDEFSFPGCVGCGRCSQVCPVKIDINDVLKKIKNQF